MSDYKAPPSLERFLSDITKRIRDLANAQGIKTYQVATRPVAANLSSPVIIYVSDAASGQRFQGWDVTAGAWVPLG